MKIRMASSKDADIIFALIKELAIYEKAEYEVVTTAAEISDSLFGENSKTSALIAEIDNKVVAYAVYFYNYSTWLGKNGIYLEDLYVTPEYRKQGVGKSLLKKIATIAVEEKCGRVEWSVLDWNTPAIEFYEALGAKAQDEWTVYRLSGKKLLNFALSN
ncbi:GNAT family N-acetyltransferase [Haliea sp. AH-315-K21]|uniref:GNAT family N-acetyltransferase n=1 Tax=SAR86 cluster bacterium TaxID=2030880 RepID=A0A2A5CF99_9GAMM|nr:GNAT family N-acetyltransferase [Haliea sp. AH-315-K21]MBN4075678.1 GNAT family N-acetyltransferase [Gammaproteobacteria bacterium AH-315-E17]PCJ42175.1 MAG: GNAT family N-acetyltransferase [SAR86 cluster bacterium]